MYLQAGKTENPPVYVEDGSVLVILLGAIGGMIMGGIIGLFIGAVLLAFSYKVFQAIVMAV